MFYFLYLHIIIFVVFSCAESKTESRRQNGATQSSADSDVEKKIITSDKKLDIKEIGKIEPSGNSESQSKEINNEQSLDFLFKGKSTDLPKWLNLTIENEVIEREVVLLKQFNEPLTIRFAGEGRCKHFADSSEKFLVFNQGEMTITPSKTKSLRLNCTKYSDIINSNFNDSLLFHLYFLDFNDPSFNFWLLRKDYVNAANAAGFVAIPNVLGEPFNDYKLNEYGQGLHAGSSTAEHVCKTLGFKSLVSFKPRFFSTPRNNSIGKFVDGKIRVFQANHKDVDNKYLDLLQCKN